MRLLARRGRRRLWPAAPALGGLALLAASGVLAARNPAPTSRLDLPAPIAEPAQQQVRSTVRAPDVEKAIPVRILIPAIRVSAPVIPLGLNPNRTIEVPQNYGETGWFVNGPEPGERGGAVIAGHVDSKTGPAVFYRLRELRRRDVIKVVLRDRSSVRFIVKSSMAVPKNRFPTKLVYSKAHAPELRLITCGGVFDRSTGHYRDNYIVFATLDKRRR